MKDTLEKIIRRKIADGDLREAMSAAQMSGRQLTDKEIEKILRYQLYHFWPEALNKSLKIINPRQSLIDKLARGCIRVMNNQIVLDHLENLVVMVKSGASEKILKKIIKEYYDEVYTERLELIIKILDSPTSNESVVDLYLEKIYKNCCDRLIITAFRKGPSKQMIEKIRKYYVKCGYFSLVEQIAQYEGKPLDEIELEQMLKFAVLNGYINDIKKILPLLKRKITSEEIELTIEARIKHGSFKVLTETTQYLLERDPTEGEVNRLININATVGDIYELNKCIRYYKRQLTKEEADLFVKYFIKGNCHSWEKVINFLQTHTKPSTELLSELLSELLKSGRWINVPIADLLWIGNMIGRPLTEDELKMVG